MSLLGRFLRARPRGLALRSLRVPGRARGLASATTSALPEAADAVESLHRIPGSSGYGAHVYDVASNTPYPIWMLDPNGVTYQVVLWVARHASEVLNFVHDTAGLPWWATILVVGVTGRFALLPFTLYSLRNVSRAADAQEDVSALVRGYQRAVTSPGMTPSQRAWLVPVLLRGLNAALRKAHCYPWHSLAIPFLQVPVLVTGVLGARHSVLLGDESFEIEGAAWFTDLTVSDPYFGLPVVALGLAYASLEVIFGGGAGARRRAPTGGAALLSRRLANAVKSGVQMSLLASVPLATALPAGLYLLMCANSAWTIAQVLVLRMPAVYKAVTGRDAPAVARPDDVPADESGSVGSKGGTVAAKTGAPSPLESAAADVTSQHWRRNAGAGRSELGGARSLDGIVRGPALVAVDAAVTRRVLEVINSIVRLSSSPAAVAADGRTLPLSLRAFSLQSERHFKEMTQLMNMVYPIMLGHPQPFVFRMAAGAPDAPWNVAVAEAALQAAPGGAGAEPQNGPDAAVATQQPQQRAALRSTAPPSERLQLVAAVSVPVPPAVARAGAATEDHTAAGNSGSGTGGNPAPAVAVPPALAVPLTQPRPVPAAAGARGGEQLPGLLQEEDALDKNSTDEPARSAAAASTQQEGSSSGAEPQRNYSAAVRRLVVRHWHDGLAVVTFDAQDYPQPRVLPGSFAVPVYSMGPVMRAGAPVRRRGGAAAAPVEAASEQRAGVDVAVSPRPAAATARAQRWRALMDAFHRGCGGVLRAESGAAGSGSAPPGAGHGSGGASGSGGDGSNGDGKDRRSLAVVLDAHATESSDAQLPTEPSGSAPAADAGGAVKRLAAASVRHRPRTFPRPYGLIHPAFPLRYSGKPPRPSANDTSSEESSLLAALLLHQDGAEPAPAPLPLPNARRVRKWARVMRTRPATRQRPPAAPAGELRRGEDAVLPPSVTGRDVLGAELTAELLHLVKGTNPSAAADRRGSSSVLSEEDLRAILGADYAAYAARKAREDSRRQQRHSAATSASSAPVKDTPGSGSRKDGAAATSRRMEIVLKDGTAFLVQEQPDADEHTPSHVANAGASEPEVPEVVREGALAAVSSSADKAPDSTVTPASPGAIFSSPETAPPSETSSAAAELAEALSDTAARPSQPEPDDAASRAQSPKPRQQQEAVQLVGLARIVAALRAIAAADAGKSGSDADVAVAVDMPTAVLRSGMLKGVPTRSGLGALIGHGVSRVVLDHHPNPRSWREEQEDAQLEAAAAADAVAPEDADAATSATEQKDGAAAPPRPSPMGLGRRVKAHRRRLASALSMIKRWNAPRFGSALESPPTDARGNLKLQRVLELTRRGGDAAAAQPVFTVLARSGLAPAAVPVLARAAKAFGSNGSRGGLSPAQAAGAMEDDKDFDDFDVHELLDAAQRELNAAPVAEAAQEGAAASGAEAEDAEAPEDAGASGTGRK